MRVVPWFFQLAVVVSVGGSLAEAATAAHGDYRVEWLRRHAVAIRSISPDDRDFSDLEPLRSAIGARRVVMLGEESHGDGATFLAKTRLIEFLHDRMGFNVLAFESGFYDMHRAWQDLASGADPIEAIRSGVFTIWTNSRQTQALWRYIASRARSSEPLVLAGIDSQFTSTASKRHFLTDLDAVLDALPHDPQLSAARRRVSGVMTSYFAARGKGLDALASFKKKITIADQALFYIAVEKIRERLERQDYRDPAKAARRDYWVQLLASTSAQMEHAWHVDDRELLKPNPKLDWGAFNIRDRQMAENLVWLARNEYAQEKIIVWAATSHEMRHRNFFTTGYSSYVPMGDSVDRVMGGAVYTVGFTAFDGEAGIGDASNIGAAAPGSLESLIHATGERYAFVDFRHLDASGTWLTEPLSCRALGYQPETTDWPASIDGLLYVETMTPSTQIAQPQAPQAMPCSERRRAAGRTPSRLSRTSSRARNSMA